MERINVLLVEDDPTWSKCIRKYINQQEGMVVCGEVTNKEDAIERVKNQLIDVVLMDINLTENNLDGIEAAEEISNMGECKIIMLTSLDRKEIILESFECGAINYITKANYKDIPDAVRNAYNNKSSVHFDVAKTLLFGFRQAKKENKLNVLTPEERRVYELKEEQGLNKSEIAQWC